MVSHPNIKLLVKILIGAAWIDGKVQPEERQYLQKIAKENGISEDPDIQPILNELVPVHSEQCYNWVREYLGDHPSQEDYQGLIEKLSALIYSDGDVANEEAKLLTRLQLLDPATTNPKSHHSAVLQTIQKLYHRWVDKQA